MNNVNEKCPICKNKLSENAALLFITEDGDEIIICDICENHIENLEIDDNKENLKKSIDYFSLYTNEITNQEISNYLETVIGNTGFVIKEKNYSVQSTPHQNTKQALPPPTYQQNTSSGWIIGMKIYAWIIFFIIIIGGIILSIPYWTDTKINEIVITKANPLAGFGIIILGFIIAFLTVALLMIFLDMAEDIKAIRNNTQTQNKDK